MTINADDTITFNQRIHNEWKDSFSPYVKALEDRIVIVDGGKVRYILFEIRKEMTSFDLNCLIFFKCFIFLLKCLKIENTRCR